MNRHIFPENKRFFLNAARSLFTLFIAFLTAFTSLAPAIPARAASGNMQITPIDFGDSGNWGDSTMVSSGGKNLLMDTYIRDKYDTLINYLDDHHFYTFDIYLSHYHYDHMDQIPSILYDSRFNISKVYLPDPAYLKKGAQSSSYCKSFLDGYDNIVKAANDTGTQIVYLKKGSSFTVGNAKVSILWGCSYSSSSYDASYINNNSLVAKVTSGTVSYLNCGDIEKQTENQILSSGINISADIFKFNHHGGNTSNTASFLKKVNPSFAYYNWVGDSPSSFGGGWVQSSIDGIKNTCNIYSTRYNGMLTFSVKAGHISVAGERNMNSVNVQIKDGSGRVVNTVNYQFNNALDYVVTASMKSSAATVTAADASTTLPTRYAYVAKFIETSGGVKYRNKDGSYSTNKFQKIDGDTYYFDQNGYRATGFKSIGGKTYYFDSDGKMLLRWKRINGKKYLFDPVDGHMHTGWEWVSEKNAWYYLSPQTGYLLEGWLDQGGKRYYLAPVDFYAVTGWQFIGGKWYFFDTKNCDMKTGWLTDGGKTYYLASNGAMVTGTQNIGGKTYTFNSSGALVGQAPAGGSGTTASSAASASAASSSGVTKWEYTGGKWKYLLNGNYLKNCFRKIDGETYLFDGNGIMLTGFQKVGGKTYYFDSSGKMLLRWKRINGRKYLFDPVDGHMHTGWEWVSENNAWYYLSPQTGYLLEGWLDQGGKRYYLAPVDFYAVTGWQFIGGKWYFFDTKNCDMKTGWLTDGGKTYYLASNGAMVTGKQSIGGRTYNFDSSGALIGEVSGQTGAGTSGSGTSSGSASGGSSSGVSITPSWNYNIYTTSSHINSWYNGSDSDMPYDTTAKRNEAFVNTMIAYATYFVGKIDYASSVTGDDPNGLRYKRLRAGGKTDCSWYVYHVLYKFGLVGDEFIHSYEWGNDPSTYPGGVNIGTDVSKASPGDIICTGKGTSGSNSHVAIYIGGGKVVECAAGYGVIISSAPSTARQVVHFSCLPSNTTASYRSASSGTWISSGSSWKFKVGGSYLTNCFQNIDGEIYYFDSNGLCAKGWKTIGGKKYYFNNDCQMLLRWKRIDGKKYYFDPVSGYMHTGWEWVAEKGAWYYLDPGTGVMVTGTRTIDGKTYTFASDGTMQ